MGDLLFAVLPLDLQKLLVRYCCPAVRYELKNLPFFVRFALVEWTTEDDRIASVCDLTKDSELYNYCLNILKENKITNRYLLKRIVKNQAFDLFTALHNEGKIKNEDYYQLLAYIKNIDNIINPLNKHLKTNGSYPELIYYRCDFQTFRKLNPYNFLYRQQFIETLLTCHKVNDRYEKIKWLYENNYSSCHSYIYFIIGNINVIKYIHDIMNIRFDSVHIEDDNLLETYNYCLTLVPADKIIIRSLQNIHLDNIEQHTNFTKSFSLYMDRQSFSRIISKINSKTEFNFILEKYHIDKVAETILLFKDVDLIFNEIEHILESQIDDESRYDIKINIQQYGYTAFLQNRRDLLLLHKLQKSGIYNIKSTKFKMVYKWVDAGILYL